MAELAENLSGRFIVIDGPDGAGKTTQVKLLAEHFRSRGAAVTQVRDPGGTPIGEKIRRIILDTASDEMAVACEMMLYMASRAQLACEVIRPALAKGDCVVCDRYISATIAYQGAGGIDPETVRAAGRIAVGDTWPDLTIILDLDIEAGLSRLTGRPDRMEAKGLEFHQRVREGFLRQASQRPASFAVVPAAGGVEEVQNRLRQLVAEWRFGG